MGTIEALEQRVAELEEFFDELQVFIGAWKKRKPPKQAALIPSPPDPMKAATSEAIIHLRNALVAKYEEVRGTKYVFDGAKDASAVKRLVFQNILRTDLIERWEEALKAKYRGSTSIALFASRINEYGKKTTAQPVRPVVEGDPYGSS